MQKVRARLDRARKLASDVYHYDFSYVEGKLDYKAGHFVLMQVEDGLEPKCTRAYSIASPPTETGFSLCIKLIEGGRGSDYLTGVEVGDVLNFSGPFGHFTLREGEKEVVMIATGTGIAPFMGMLPVLFESGFKQPVNLIFGTSHEKNLLYVKDLKRMEAKNPNFTSILTVSRPSEDWNGAVGRVQVQLEELPFEPENTVFYICGIGQMVVDVRKLLMEEMGVPKESIHFEQFTPPTSL